jgi:protein ImuB
MLWLAFHFHSLSLEVFSRGAAVPEPLAVVEKQGSRTWVIACNDAAEACGVHVGMAAPAAQALADGLIVRKRDPAAERESLAGLAVWAGRFTPSVSLEPPAGLLLEISTCLSLHRGLRQPAEARRAADRRWAKRAPWPARRRRTAPGCWRMRESKRPSASGRG